MKKNLALPFIVAALGLNLLFNLCWGQSLSPKANKSQFISDLIKVLEDHRQEFIGILVQKNNYYGADYEVDLVLRTLRGFDQHEKHYFEGIDTDKVKRVAVYAARNVPLMTTVQQGLFPALVADEVYLRTPSRTREVYNQILSKIKALMPQYSFDSLVFTDDNYRKFMMDKVLNISAGGNNFQGKGNPSSVVIFTGSPETATTIEESMVEVLNRMSEKVESANREKDKITQEVQEMVDNLGKIKSERALTSEERSLFDSKKGKLKKLLSEEKRKGIENFKLLFLKFGNGLNPAVITKFAAKNLQPAIGAAVRAIKMNTAQDCTSPKFFAVHQSVYSNYVQSLQKIVDRMKYGELSDPNADYSYMSYAEQAELDRLTAFRDKYEKFITNKQTASISQDDQGKIKITPHIFEFPYEMFKEVDLQDHFAPFIIIFKYPSKAALEAMANDPRVTQKAMFASIFGDSSEKKLSKVVSLFKKSYMNTVINRDVYDAEPGYKPYGGWGKDSASLEIISGENSPSVDMVIPSKVKMKIINRPLLFSKDTVEYFPRSDRNNGKVLFPLTELTFQEIEKSRKKLQQIIALASDPKQGFALFKGKVKLIHPRLERYPHGLEFIQQMIKEKGFFFVTDENRPNKKQFQSHKKLFGVPLKYAGDQTGHYNGVAFFSTGVDNDTETINSISGEFNLSQGFGFTHHLLHDRVNEYHMSQAIWPGMMAHSSTVQDLREEGILGKDFIGLRSEILQDIQNKKLTNDKLTKFIHLFMGALKKKYPMGAFLKNYGESTTGDLGIQITSFNYNTDNMIKQYREGQNKSLGHYATEAKFLNQLIKDPFEILVQERMKIAETALGYPMEFRVDFVDGVPLMVKNRFSTEYYPEEEEKALQVMETFFAKAKSEFPEMSYLSGGADVALLEDGRWKIIEYNMGANSGSIDPRYFPIEANLFLSKLTGKDTPLTKELKELLDAPLEQQNAYLKGRKVERKKWTIESVDDISVAELAKWLRDHQLNEYRKNLPSKDQASLNKDKADMVMKNLKTLFQGVGRASNRDLPFLIRAAENFLYERGSQETH